MLVRKPGLGRGVTAEAIARPVQFSAIERTLSLRTRGGRVDVLPDRQRLVGQLHFGGVRWPEIVRLAMLGPRR